MTVRSSTYPSGTPSLKTVRGACITVKPALLPRRQLLLDGVDLLVNSQHEGMKVNAFLLGHVIAGDVEKIHQHGFAAADGTPDVDAFWDGRVVK